MRKGLMLMVVLLAVMLFNACADTNSYSRSRRDSMIDRANMCATCGSAIQDNYFAGSAFRAVGPGNY